MGKFQDKKTGEMVRGTMLGFAGDEDPLQSVDTFRDWFGAEIHPGKSHSFTSSVRSAIRNGNGEKIWALVSDSHVEAVTDSEYYRRRP